MSTHKNINSKSNKKAAGFSRKTYMIINICFTVFLILFLVWGIAHTFTGKNKYRNKGIDCYKQGEYEAAADYFTQALDCNQWFSEKVNVDVSMYLGECYIKTEKFEQARECYLDIINNYSDKYYDKTEIEYLISVVDNLIVFSKGDYTASLDGLKDAVDRGYDELALYVALCYEKKDDLDNMKKYYDIYSSSHGLNSYLALKYTQYYIITGDNASALDYAQKGIGLEDKKYEKELEYLRIVCNTKLADFDTAYSLSDEYIAKYPDDLTGKALNEYLYTRVNVDEVPVNDKFHLYDGEQ